MPVTPARGPSPPPWRVDKIPAATSSVANGQSLAYLYSRQDPTEAHQAKTLTADEGRRGEPDPGIEEAKTFPADLAPQH
jgi:hypothetical protein